MDYYQKQINNSSEHKWWESDWYKEWVILAHNKPKQPEIGYWYYDNDSQTWKFQNPN